MAHLFINDIKAGLQINDVYMVTQPVLRNTTRGDLYIAMYLSDRTGKINARMWQATQEGFNMLPKPGFVHIRGRSELYKDNLQVVINQFSVVDQSQVNLEDFLAKTDKNTDQMFQEVIKILGKIKNAQIKMLIGAFLADKKLMENFA